MAPHATSHLAGQDRLFADRPHTTSTPAMEDIMEPIAVIGYSVGFPQDATDSDAFWKVLLEKRSTATAFPASRMNINAIYHPDTNRRGQIPVHKSHFLKDDLAYFDAAFFSTSSTDAASMDPQQRLLLEYTYKALENAGLPMEDVSGTKTSVYTGVFSTDWQHLAYKDGEQCGTTTALGVQACFNANRISWFFNLTGNSANIDTACSSSLVCLDLGCQGLRSGEEDMSIVAGCNVILSPDNMHSLTNLNMLSPDGQCYSFDHRANGYSRGEGFAVLVLKRVSDAIRDGDTIRAVIRSTGSNQDGNTPSITLPNHISQETLIRETYRKAGLSMEPTRFFEAHGTGTSVGDPIESKALGSAFRHARSLEDPLWVGAVKSNIGHLEGASGIAGVIKALLVLEKAIIPPNTNFEKANPKIDAEFLRIQFPLEAISWPKRGLRRASVNSFGNAGTNAHVVLDDVYHFLEERGLVAHHHTVCNPPDLPNDRESSRPNNSLHDLSNGAISFLKDRRPRLLLVSANDDAGPQRQADAFASHFSCLSKTSIFDHDYMDRLAFTLSFKRSKLQWKSFAVVSSMDDLCQFDKRLSLPKKLDTNPGLALVFTGQGAQWAGMGAQLMTYPAFRHSMLRSEEYLLERGCAWRLCEEIFQETSTRINSPEIAQPACTAIQIALLDFLTSVNVYPVAVVGHSSGEIAAAYSAGAISSTSALKLAYLRGVSSKALANSTSVSGGMAAVSLSKEAAESYIKEVTTQFQRPGLVIACINSPHHVTISGDLDQLEQLLALLSTANVTARKLVVDVAYHSPHMELIADQYRKSIGELEPGIMTQKATHMFSSVTGKRVLHKELTMPEYWVQNMTSPVDFLGAVNEMLTMSATRIRKKLDLSHRDRFRITQLLEVGPHSALQGPTKGIMANLGSVQSLEYNSLLIRRQAADDSALTALGHLACGGISVDMDRVNCPIGIQSTPRHTLHDLPGYVFNHSKKYWDESRMCAVYRLQPHAKLDLLGKPVADWNHLEPIWRNFLRVSEMPWIEDHIINGSLIYPGAGMVVMAIEAAHQISQSESDTVGVELKEVSFVKTLGISTGSTGVETRLSIRMPQTRTTSKPLYDWAEFRLFSFENETWEECCHGNLRVKYRPETNEVDERAQETSEIETLASLSQDVAQACQNSFDPKDFYGNLHVSGLGLGPSFQRVVSASFSDSKQVQGVIKPFDWRQEDFYQDHIVHPTTLDAIFHLSIAGFSNGGQKKVPTMVPTFLRNLFVSTSGLSCANNTLIHESAWFKGEDVRTTTFAASALDSTNTKILMQFDDLVLTKIGDSRVESSSEEAQAHQMIYHVVQKPDPDLLHWPKTGQLSLDSKQQSRSLSFYMDLLCHKNPDTRILQIGGNCLESTTSILQSLLTQGIDSKLTSPRYGSYSFAEHTEEGLQSMQREFEGYPLTNFKMLDPEEDISTQIENDELFDVILISISTIADDIHLRHIRRLLKTKGKIILHGTTPTNVPDTRNGLNYSMSTLNTPSFELSSTDQGICTVFVEQDLSGNLQELANRKICLIVDMQSTQQKQAADSITACLKIQGSGAITIVSLKDAASNPKLDLYIVLLELDNDFLYNISEGSFDLLKNLITSVHDILWINNYGGSVAGKPEQAVVHGFARALRSEFADLSMTVLSLHFSGALLQHQLQHVTTILLRNHLDAAKSQDAEYLEIGTILHIPRVYPTANITHEISVRAQPQKSGTVSMASAPPLKLVIGSLGLLNTLHFIADPSVTQPLESDEVEITTLAVGVNFKDVLAALGQLPSASIGQECAGIVRRAGPGTDFKQGDRVIMVATETFKTFTRGRATGVFKMPDNLPMTTGAAIPAQFGTAWAVIHRLARLQKGESVLIHAAAGGTGQAIIQLAQKLGAVVFATVSSREKKELLTDYYNIPKSQIFYSRDTSFAQGIKRMTKGRGVDVVINSVVGEKLQASWECIAPCGRFIEIGKRDILSNSMLPMYAFRNNVSFMAFDGPVWVRERPDEAHKDLETVVSMFADGTLQLPRPFRVCDVSEVERVLRHVQDGHSFGKTVVTLEPTSQVSAVLDTEPSFMLFPNATYVIAGGLGGIGRATARWLADRGAQNLVLLSRFGPRTEQAHNLIASLLEKNVRVETPACDVTDLSTMRDTFERISRTMPPIKGCFQMSIVARDCLFKDMNYGSWKPAVECKSIGSHNLDIVMPKDLDFFIMLSSASGLAGIQGQTNYDAGNTYEDALARDCVARGQKAVALDLGAMVDDGILAENSDLLQRVQGYGTLESISRLKFYGILDYYCNPTLPLLMPEQSQVAIGLGVGGGEGLVSLSYARQPMLLPLSLAGSRLAATMGREGHGGASAKELFAATESLDKASEVVAQAVVKQLSQSIEAMQDGNVDMHKPLQTYGVDSLLAIELRNWIVKEFRADVAVFDTQGASTLSTLSILVAGKSEIPHADWNI